MQKRIRNLTEQEKLSLEESQMIADWLKIFSKGFKELSQYFDGIYCTNSYSDLDSMIPFINISKNGNTFVKQLNI